jgi:hypothetical protein
MVIPVADPTKADRLILEKLGDGSSRSLTIHPEACTRR